MTRDETIERIAAETLGIDILKTRGRDRLDYHDLGVTQLRKALEEAYEAGKNSGRP